MDKVVVEGIPAFNGEYPIDLEAFTMRELNIIKRMSGVRAGELSEAFEAGDTDLLLAIAVIAVRRNGHQWEAFEKLAWEVDMAKITFVGDEEEVADSADPLTLTPLEPNGSNGELPQSSGMSSLTVGAASIPETNHHGFGSRESEAV